MMMSVTAKRAVCAGRNHVSSTSLCSPHSELVVYHVLYVQSRRCFLEQSIAVSDMSGELLKTCWLFVVGCTGATSALWQRSNVLVLMELIEWSSSAKTLINRSACVSITRTYGCIGSTTSGIRSSPLICWRPEIDVLYQSLAALLAVLNCLHSLYLRYIRAAFFISFAPHRRRRRRRRLVTAQWTHVNFCVLQRSRSL